MVNYYLTNPWWEDKPFSVGVERPKYLDGLVANLDQKLIQIITGLRRVGKSTLVLQLIKYLLEKKSVDAKYIFHFSLDNPVIKKFSIKQIIDEYRAEHDIKIDEKVYVFIDEVQFYEGWEQEVKSLYDFEKIKFVLTGSSAMLLSEKLSLLTGRFLKSQVHSLSFEEYLSFKKIEYSNTNKHILLKKVEEFLVDGGMPEYILSKPDRYLETTVESILFKDLVSKFQLRNPQVLTDLIYLLSDRIGTTSSSLKLAKILEEGKDLILTYVNYLNKTFITSELSNYSTSRNKEIYNPNKLYFEDTGIAFVYSSKKNMGALVENAVYLHLNNLLKYKVRAKLGYWYENKKEVDFVATYKQKTILVESKYIDTIDELDFSSVVNASNDIKPKQIIYVTRTYKGLKSIGGIEVLSIPLYEFLQLDVEDLFKD